MDGDGTVYLFFGGMQEGSGCNGSVDSDGVLATSTDGFNFTNSGDALDHSDTGLWGHGDELFPTDVLKIDGTWYALYGSANR